MGHITDLLKKKLNSLENLLKGRMVKLTQVSAKNEGYILSKNYNQYGKIQINAQSVK